ncbi:MAG: glutamate--tRNA ligase family protein, partial [Vicinamibacterales bacterium]
MKRSTTRRRLPSSTSPFALNGVGSTEYTPSSFNAPLSLENGQVAKIAKIGKIAKSHDIATFRTGGFIVDRIAVVPSLTRFAPAPTGWLHLGHVLNASYVWNTARARGARVLLRIEDHD